MQPKISSAAETGSAPDGIITLNKDTVYEYDLNGDGKSDKIRYEISGNEEQYKTIIKLYVNDKLCLTKEDDGMSFSVKLLDLDKSDKFLDFFVSTTMESDCKKNSFFVRYDNKKMFNYVNFDIDKLTNNFNISRYSIEKLDGDGKFTVLIDTPIFSQAIGCYYCYVPFQFKDNAITVVPTTYYSLSQSSVDYKYKAAKGFSVYEKIGSKKVVYKVNKGDKVTFDKMYISKYGNAYFRIKNSKGKSGWIKSNQENLFVEQPAWG